MAYAERARELFTTYAGFNAAGQIAFLACVWSLAVILKRLVADHTGVSALTATSSSGKPLAQIFARRTVLMRVLSVLMSVMSVAYFYFVTDVQRVALRGGDVSKQMKVLAIEGGLFPVQRTGKERPCHRIIIVYAVLLRISTGVRPFLSEIRSKL